MSIGAAIMAASSTTVTRPAVSLIAANGVTEPGSTPRSSRRSSAEPNENRPEAPRSRCSDFSSIAASSLATTRYGVPFLSRRNRFLVWPPGIAPRSSRAFLDGKHRRMGDGLVGDAEPDPDRRKAHQARQACAVFRPGRSRLQSGKLFGIAWRWPGAGTLGRLTYPSRMRV